MTSKQHSTSDGWFLRTRTTSSQIKVVPERVVSGVKRSAAIFLKEPGSSRQKQLNIDNVDLLSLESDPGLRKPIFEFNPNQIDAIRREYIFTKGPCQPNQESYPLTSFGKQNRSFQKKWFSEFNWLEYSVEKDACFCLYCYLFNGSKGADCFVIDGFRNWKKKDKLRLHVGNINSAHNKAYIMGQNLIEQNQHIDIAFFMQDSQERDDYKGRLESSIKVVRLLLELGIPFRGHDEKDESERRGNFLTVLQFLAENSPEVKRLQQEAPGNSKLIAPKIQKEIVRACAIETVNVIINNIGDACFALLVDESRDISIKEQMVIAIRYVDNRGCVIESVIGFIHVLETTSATLKKGIDGLLSKHNLSTKKMHGQGYDGASNMRGEYSGLKSLFLQENKHAFYVHCFAHQLQLTLVNVAKNFRPIMNFFDVVSSTITLVGVSCKRKDGIRELQVQKIIDGVQSGELKTGRGLNQETSLRRAADTRWGSHYDSLLRIISMFPVVIDILTIIDKDGETKESRGKAEALKYMMLTYDYVFKLFVMKKILGITNSLSKSLQRKDQDIVNAIALLKLCKERFQEIRDNGWDDLVLQVSEHCKKNDIDILDMSDKFRGPKRHLRGEETTNDQHYRVGLFYVIIDMQVSELEERFPELSTELLYCMGSLSPAKSFSAFDKNNLLRMASLYEVDFSSIDLLALGDELDMYHLDMVSDKRFCELKGMPELSLMMVKTGKNLTYPLVYALLTFALILPVSTATVERAFSAMKIVKTELRNRMGDAWMSDSLIVYIEQKIFLNIDIKTIAKRFQGLEKRRKQLPLDY